MKKHCCFCTEMASSLSNKYHIIWTRDSMAVIRPFFRVNKNIIAMLHRGVWPWYFIAMSSWTKSCKIWIKTRHSCSQTIFQGKFNVLGLGQFF
jgi:hypothetical protein